MTWVLIYLAIAFAGLVMVGCFAWWLWGKAVALLEEADVLLDRADELAGVLAQLGQPVESGPAESGPVESGPVESGPFESQPVESASSGNPQHHRR